MVSPILRTKICLPPARQSLVLRPRLLQRLDENLSLPLTLVSASAGFGKTSLLTLWIEHHRTKPDSGAGFPAVAWLSLDPIDNQPVRFWAYFIAALQAGLSAPLPGNGLASPAQLTSLIELLQTDPPPDLYSVLDSLINQIISLQQPFLLILDDYHVVHCSQIHEQLGYLVDHCPDNLHLVIATRTDPPLPLARLRARRQLGEFRAVDLRFTAQETDQFFKEILCLDLPRQEIQAVETSTEGWVAGLQMAGLALQAHLDELAEQNEQTRKEKAHEFIFAFSGKNMYILDFLTDEVFNRQTEEVQAFLLKTSILEQMNAELCDAVMDQADEQNDTPRPASARQILDYLEKANLFIIPLDQNRNWYRYHHLFADLLRVRLDHRWPKRKQALQTRAAQWCAQNGFEEEAITYALAASDWDLAGELIEKNIQRFLELGQLSQVLDWIVRLPKEISRNRAGLCIQQAWVMGIAQRQDEFVSLLNDAERLLLKPNADPTLDSQTIGQLNNQLTIMRAYQTIIEGNPAQAVEKINASVQSLPTSNLWEGSWAYWIKAFAFRMMGEFSPAIESLRSALFLCREKIWVDMVCCTDLGMIYHQQGKLPEAREILLQGLELQKFHTRANHGYLARLVASLCEVLVDMNKLDEAVQYGEMGLAWLKWWPSGNTWSQLFVALGRVKLAQGDLAGATDFILRADRDRQSWPLRPLNNSQVDDALVRLWLATHNFDALEQWAQLFLQKQKTPLKIPSTPDESLLIDLITYARIRLAQGYAGSTTALEEAGGILSQLKSTIQNRGRIRYWIEINILSAAALQFKMAGNANRLDAQALTCLRESVTAGEPGRFIRPFVEGGPLIEKMLQALHTQPEPVQKHALNMQYLDAIVTAFQSRSDQPVKNQPAQDLREPVSEREREVLRLLAAGFSNQEMAQKLFVSEGTIKSHLHHLFGKLDVRSRTQLIARAKALNLL